MMTNQDNTLLPFRTIGLPLLVDNGRILGSFNQNEMLSNAANNTTVLNPQFSNVTVSSAGPVFVNLNAGSSNLNPAVVAHSMQENMQLSMQVSPRLGYHLTPNYQQHIPEIILSNTCSSRSRRYSRHRKNTHNWSPAQDAYLEKVYYYYKYLNRDLKRLLANGLSVAPDRLKQWFQNRRTRDRLHSKRNGFKLAWKLHDPPMNVNFAGDLPTLQQILDSIGCPPGFDRTAAHRFNRFHLTDGSRQTSSDVSSCTMYVTPTGENVSNILNSVAPASQSPVLYETRMTPSSTDVCETSMAQLNPIIVESDRYFCTRVNTSNFPQTATNSIQPYFRTPLNDCSNRSNRQHNNFSSHLPQQPDALHANRLFVPNWFSSHPISTEHFPSHQMQPDFSTQVNSASFMSSSSDEAVSMTDSNFGGALSVYTVTTNVDQESDCVQIDNNMSSILNVDCIKELLGDDNAMVGNSLSASQGASISTYYGESLDEEVLPNIASFLETPTHDSTNFEFPAYNDAAENDSFCFLQEYDQEF